MPVKTMMLAACSLATVSAFLTGAAHSLPTHAARFASPAVRMAVELPRKVAPTVAATIETSSSTTAAPTTDLSQDGVILSLAQGNKRYMSNMGKAGAAGSSVSNLVDDPLSPTPVQALVISCAMSYAPIDAIFDAEPGMLHSLRVCGYVAQPNDGVVGSCEFALEQYAPPVLVVLGNERNDVIATAVARAMKAEGRKDVPKLKAIPGDEDEINGLLKALEAPASDAVSQAPSADFEGLCKLAAKLNVWRTIEVLLTTSKTICERVQDGRLQVHGAYFEVSSGRVQMLGQHPATEKLTAVLPNPEFYRTAADVAVPPEEAIAALYAGNQRFVAGMGGQLDASDKGLLGAVTSGGQKPFAIVLGCADSRCPVELLFDGRPGDIFVLRNAGNTLISKSGATLGSAEYAIGPLDSKLLVVTGHTKCGAVTAAVQTALAGAETSSVGGSIGKVLDNIIDAANAAIKELPEGTLDEQVALATKINVFNAMARIVEYSDSFKQSVISGAVHIHGSVYDIETGKVEWLGEHPELEKLTGEKLPAYDWRNSVYESRMASAPPKGRSATSRAGLQRLRLGNERFVKGEPMPVASKPDDADNRFAIVLGMAEVRVPIEKIFDAGPGDLVVQRVSGGIAGREDSTLFSSVEYAVKRWSPKVLVVLADSNSKIVQLAIDQATGGVIPTSPQRGVLDRVMVSAMRAQLQVDVAESMTAAGRELKIKQLTTELNAFYTIEQLLKSDVVRDAVVNDGLELHAAVLDETTGNVEILGEHPALEGIVGAKLKSS